MKRRRTQSSTNGKRTPAQPRRPPLTIEEKLQKLALEIPEKELRRIPRDLSVNLDHYLYGMPKRW